MRLNLSDRLIAISSMVDNGAIIYDVGTDHAFIPIYLAKNQRIIKGYASDLRSGPCKIAQKNVELFALQDKITVIQSDGLKSLKDDVTTIIIAGMGGGLITTIIEESYDKISEKQVLILQPNTNVKDVRMYLASHGFTIIDEEVIFEDDHFYEIMKVVKKTGELTENEMIFGPILMKKKSPVFISKYQKEKVTYEAVLEKLTDSNIKRRQEILDYIQRIEEIL
jgi:tRNA (adenine22-N1)-methyltransferase